MSSQQSVIAGTTAQRCHVLRPRRRSESRGFTLMEALVGLLILTVVTAAIFSELNQVQKASASEATKLDLTQQAREFADQMVRDLHMTGYPRPDMYSPALAVSNPLVAAGLVKVSPAEILLEGDVETSGTVDSVDIQYVAADPNDPNCPCIRRTETPKVNAGPLAQPPAPANAISTQVEHVMDPGQSGEDLFTFFDKNGNAVNVGAGLDMSNPLINSIETVKINLNLLSPNIDPMTRLPQRIALSVTGHLNNN
ncbi:MAG TPA: prepilin-type N-terminal cleavage/methylation domain-containing protein [Candidatus Angelobacter sp.]|nr:prepilin-type N-terminal cleavage/methylation domain-containing protein [Candidatus Angelobacter sp.]